MKKKILSLALTLAMLVTLLCIGGVTASAAEYTGWRAVGESAQENIDYVLVLNDSEKSLTIYTARGFAWFANTINDGANFRQMTVLLGNDINLDCGLVAGYDADINTDFNSITTTNSWIPIGIGGTSFLRGVFDGQNHTISGVKINGVDCDSTGLFGMCAAEIKNLGVINSRIHGSDRVGGIAGDGVTFVNCYSTAVVYGTGDSVRVGGITGSGSAINCYNIGAVSGYGTTRLYIGGIVGTGTVSNCYNTGNVYGSGNGVNIGGVCGDPDRMIENSFYLDTCGASGNGTSKTAAQFKSGEVAYLLNGSTSEGELTWLMKNGLPTLDKSGDVAVFDGRNLYSVLEKHGTAVTYTVDPTYTVTIPQTVTLGESVSISADNVVVDEGKQVNVKLTATSGENNTAFTVATQKGATLTYAITKDSDAVAIGDTVLTVNPANGKTGSTTLSFSAPTGAQYSGTYKGTVTFTVSVDDIPA